MKFAFKTAPQLMSEKLGPFACSLPQFLQDRQHIKILRATVALH